MAQADSNNSITSRRRFLTVAAAASAVSATALAAAAMPVRQTCLDDRAILKLEELVFEQYEGANAHNLEIHRLFEIWMAENERLADEVYAGRSALTSSERWDLVSAMPEAKEHNRLERLQHASFDRMNEYTKQMFAIPARTPDGRRAKAAVLISCVMGADWRRVVDETDYDIRMARNLLLDFVGGEPGEELRGQFA